MTKSDGLLLYEYPGTRSARCRWTLQELNVPFSGISIDFKGGGHRDPEFLKLNPYGRVPVLVEGDMVLCESAALCLSLGDRYRDRAVVPEAGTRDRGYHDQWVFFCTNELEQPLWRIFHQSVLYPEDKRLPGDIEFAREDFKGAARILEEFLHNKHYLVGDRFTVADIITSYTLYWADSYGLLEGFPALQDYLVRQSERPACPEELNR